MILGMRQQMNGASPSVLALFLSDPADYETLSTLSSMPTGGSISRAGNAMHYDSTGKLTWAPNNLLLYSEQIDNAAWSKLTSTITPNATTAPDGALTADKLIGTAGSTNIRIQQAVSLIAGNSYVYSIYAKAGEYDVLRVQRIDTNINALTHEFNLTSGTASGGGSIAAVGNGWYRCSGVITCNTTASTGPLFIAQPGATGNGTSGLFVWGAMLEAVTWQTTPRTYLPTTSAARFEPRFDVDPATGQAKGLLLEGARTNLLVRSNEFTNASWVATSATISAGAGTGPDGVTNSAYRIYMANSAQTPYQVYNFAAGTTYTFSVWVKRNIGSNQTFRLGKFQTTNATSANLTATDVWQRFSFTFVGDGSTLGDPSVYFLVGSGGGGADLQVFGAQLEVGAWASSYIPTQATTTSRAAETFTLTGYANRLIEAYWIEQETGVASSIPETVVSSGAVTINPPQFGWVTSLRAYQNGYAGDIATPSWIDNSGTTGNRMVTDSTGTLTWAPANELSYSEDYSQSVWVKTPFTLTAGQDGPFGTANATKVVLNSGSQANTVLYRAFTGVATATYIVSLYLKAAGTQLVAFGLFFDGTNFAAAQADLSNGTITRSAASGTGYSISSASIVPVTGASGWYRVSAVVVSPSTAIYPGVAPRMTSWTSGAPGATQTGDGSSGILVTGFQLERVTWQQQPRAYIPTTAAAVYLPRYDYSPATTPASPLGMLIEESRGNLLTYSQNFGAGTVTSIANGSVTSNAATAPDGTATAALVIPDATSSQKYWYKQFTASATAYSFSVYAKAGGYNVVRLADLNSGNGATFDLTTGASSSVAAGFTASSSYVGNGWWRFAITFTPSAGTVLPGAYIRQTTSFAGDGVSGVYFWGAQVEAGAFATSYIPTTPAAVTRVADVVKLSGAALTTLGAPAWSFVSEQSTNSFAQYRRIFEATGQGAFAAGATANQIICNNFTPVSLTATIGSSGSWNNKGVVRAALSTNGSGRSIVVNNGTVASDANIMFSSAPTNVLIGSRTGNDYLNGYLSSLAIYNQRLPDATLKAKSVVGSAY